MAAYLRNQAVSSLKSMLSLFSSLRSFVADRYADQQLSVSVHKEPLLDLQPRNVMSRQSFPTNPQNTYSQDAMANRDGRRAPVLHAGESAQRRLF